MSDKDKIFIFDTTMRDGEQSPGASMSLEEKIQIARIFDELGIDVIEAGFPIASPGDFEAVTAISKILKNSIPCGLSRASKKDIDVCHEALKASPRFRIHTFISTSPLHMKHKLNKSPEQVLDAIKESVTYARNLTDDVEWSCEDGTRTDMDYMCKSVELAISCGAKTINIPDTVGYTIPAEFTKIITTLKNKVPNIDKAILSVHCHNDLGLAVANSLAGVAAGARQVECTINGIGERAGNAALEEIVMAIRTRNDLMPYSTGIKTELLSKASKVVSNATFPVQFNKAIVGKNAFAHESGIHQDGMLKNSKTFEIMRPADVGLSDTNLVLGKHSGRAALRSKLTDLGYEIGDNKLKDIFVRFKALADRKKEIFDDDLIALMIDQSSSEESDRIHVKSLKVVCGTGGPSTSELTLIVDGKEKAVKAIGDGPVDAAFNAVNSIISHTARLQLYQVHAVTEGTDAQAIVSVKMEENGKISTGESADTDTVVASTKAYVNALNRLLIRRQKVGLDIADISYKDAS